MKSNTKKLLREKIIHWRWILVVLVIALIATIILSSTIGTGNISLTLGTKMIISEIPILNNFLSQSFSESTKTIFLDFRLPRIIVGILVGSALSVAGVTIQGIFRNPMAEPYTVGVSAGASLGAVTAISYGLGFLGVLTLPLMSFIFSMVSIFIVYNIAKVNGKLPVGILLLAGITMSFFLSSITQFLEYTAGEQLHNMVFWIMGGLWNRSWTHVQIVLPPVILGSIGIYYYSRGLNTILLGEESSHQLGIEVEKMKKILIVLASLITAAAVSVSGIIGFVGLIIPHTMRILVGADHRILIPSSALAGGVFLVWADNIARTIITPEELPVGIITAIAGAPFFVYLLKKRKYSF